MTRTAKVPCPGKNCKKRCEARCDLWSSLGMDWVDRLSEGTRKELGWLGWSVDVSGAPGFLQLASRKRVPGAPGGRSCTEATWNLQISQANKLKKKRVSLVFFHVSSSSQIQTLKSACIFTCTLVKQHYVWFSQWWKMGCFYFFAWPWIHHGFSHASNVQLAESHRQLGSREASVAKVPSNSNLDANCW